MDVEIKERPPRYTYKFEPFRSVSVSISERDLNITTMRALEMYFNSLKQVVNRFQVEERHRAQHLLSKIYPQII
jgi:hypothetical protein